MGKEPTWRLAGVGDGEAIVALASALYAEDPGEEPVPPEQTLRTLEVLRAEPSRGRAMALDADGRVAGYALLVSFWSNELGGELCVLDEIYVEPALRSRGMASSLVDAIARGEAFSGRPVAIELEVSPKNARARALYERLGFAPLRNARMRRRLG